MVKCWLRITRNMATLNSAIRGLTSNKKGLQLRMRRVSPALVVYLIWEERNKRVFDNIDKSINLIFRKYQIMFYTILYFHDKNPMAYNVAD
jgi:hypothetical protein